jgi:hypothetical protein
MTNVYNAAELKEVYGITLRVNEDNPSDFVTLQAACRRLNYLSISDRYEWDYGYMNDIITLRSKGHMWVQILLYGNVEHIQSTAPELVCNAIQQCEQYFVEHGGLSHFLQKDSPLLQHYKKMRTTCENLGIKVDSFAQKLLNVTQFTLKPDAPAFNPSHLIPANDDFKL